MPYPTYTIQFTFNSSIATCIKSITPKFAVLEDLSPEDVNINRKNSKNKLGE